MSKERDRSRDRNRSREKDREYSKDRDRSRDKDRERSKARDRSKDRDRSRDRIRSRDRDRSRDRYRSSHRDKSRERSRYDDYRRDDRYHSDRYRDDRYGSRYDRSDRHDRDRDRGRDYRRRDRSRSRSRDRRRRRRQSRSNSRFRNESVSKSRSKSKSRSRSNSRMSERSSGHSSVQGRMKRDLSVEIEQELQNLRKLSDMKAAVAKLKEEVDAKATHSESSDSEKAEHSNQSASSSNYWQKQTTPLELTPKINFGRSSKEEFVPEIQTEEERIEFQKKMQEKLQAHLAAEGKLYPKPKPSQAMYSATGFANDGSFLEMFKRMQEHMVMDVGFASTSGSVMPVVPSQQPSISAITAAQQTQPKPPVPVVGRRRGGKILKTGIVKKQKPIEESAADTPNDAWNLYLAEVRKYKNASCDADSKTRPLVK